MEALVHPKKSLVLILVNQTQNFVGVWILMLIIVICLLIEIKYLNLKPTLKMLTLQLIFFLEVYLIDLEPRRKSLNGNVYDFSVDNNSIDKSEILNIYKYLMNKKNNV